MPNEDKKKKKPFGVYRSDANPPEEEEGLRETSFFELPGAHEIKGKLKKHISELDVPGAKLAAAATDLLVPETLAEVSGPLSRGVSGAISKMSEAAAPAARAIKTITRTGSYMKPADEAGALAKASKAAKEAEAPALDYSKFNPSSYPNRREAANKVNKGHYMEDSTVEIINPEEAERLKQESLARMRKGRK